MVRPAYHVADPILARLPYPTGAWLEDRPFAGIRRLRMARTFAGRTLADVSCWLAGDTLIDSGLSSLGPRVAAIAHDAGVRRTIITHHHEDHAGGAAALAAAGIEVLASPTTCRLISRVLPIRPYQHVVWGRAAPVVAWPLPDELEVDGRRAMVLPAQGHSVDQVVLWLPSEGWLFSGDVFVAERVKAFRRDEDFAATVATLERLCALGVDALLCAHRPRATGGGDALAGKLHWLRELEARVRTLAASGAGIGEITARLRIPGTRGLAAFTLGDASTANLVRSVLEGPRPRPEVVAACADPPPLPGRTHP